MSYYEKEYKQRLLQGQRSNALILLISIHLILFVILAFVRAIYALRYENAHEAALYFNTNVLNWFALPADLSVLATKPWTLITHMFVHADVWHVFGNMLWLWMFGYILQDLTGNRKIFPVFLYGAFAGAIAFILAVNFLPALKPGLHEAAAIGASAGVMAIAAAVTTLAPGYRIFPMLNGGIPLWIITAFYLLIDLAFLSDDNTGGRIAHLAGAVAGYFFIYSYRKGVDWGGWMNNFYDWFNDLFNPARPKKGKVIKHELFYRSAHQPYQKTPNLTSKRVDEILDKINQHGYHSLTDEERELLKKASKEEF